MICIRGIEKVKHVLIKSVEALSHADTLEISCHSPTIVLLPTLESMDSKRHIQAFKAIQRTFIYKITEVQHLNYLERLHELKLYTLSRDALNVI